MIYALCVLVGFLIALLHSNSRSAKETEIEGALNNKISSDNTTTQADQAKADQELESYDKELSSLDPSFHNDDGSGKPTN